MAIANNGFCSLGYGDWKIKYYDDEFGTDAYAEYVPYEGGRTTLGIRRVNGLSPMSEYVLSVSHRYSFYAAEISDFSYESFEEDVASCNARTMLEAIDLLCGKTIR